MLIKNLAFQSELSGKTYCKNYIGHCKLANKRIDTPSHATDVKSIMWVKRNDYSVQKFMKIAYTLGNTWPKHMRCHFEEKGHTQKDDIQNAEASRNKCIASLVVFLFSFSQIKYFQTITLYSVYPTNFFMEKKQSKYW